MSYAKSVLDSANLYWNILGFSFSLGYGTSD